MTDQVEGTPANHEIASTLETLRRRRKELAAGRTPLDLDIPGYGGELVARFHVLPWLDFKAVGERVQKIKHPSAELFGQIDTLIRACDRVMIRVGGNLIDIDPDYEMPVKFEKKLAEILGFEAESAREVVRKLFNNDLAISAMYVELAQWMQQNTEEADADFLGESKAKTR